MMITLAFFVEQPMKTGRRRYSRMPVICRDKSSWIEMDVQLARDNDAMVVWVKHASSPPLASPPTPRTE